MKRQIINELIKWKENPRRKPLVMQGARQVGKTWIVKEFGKLYYKQLAYINFENAKPMRNLFVQDFDIERILLQVKTYCNVPIVAGETLIFFDEIQEAEGGLTALKYFKEMAPELHIVVAGSLLGISIHKGLSFPVGMVNFMELYPMSFSEFLDATGETMLAEMLRAQRWDVIEPLHQKLVERLKHYFYVGGMPEAVKAFVERQDWAEVREIHQEILRGYENDFSKHAPTQILPRIQQIWRSIPKQLSRENRKFLFGLIKEGARAREYEESLQWIYDSGLLYDVHCLTSPKIPLSAYIDERAFKVYLNDVGLLATLSDLDAKTLLYDNAIFVEFKGALTEQYVFGELRMTEKLYYWSKESSSQEVDFIIQKDSAILPIEVKSNENVRSKSLKTFVAEQNLAHAYRTSMLPYHDDGWLTNIPLYGIESIGHLQG